MAAVVVDGDGDGDGDGGGSDDENDRNGEESGRNSHKLGGKVDNGNGQ
jgi:hypothetical protein